jgi:hypothetical protein
MTMRAISCGALLLLTLSSTGCALMQPLDSATRQTWQMMKPNGTDYRDDSDEEIDDWAFVGEEARGDRPKEEDPDPWWQKWVMSSRARSIERNLGIE